MNRPKRVLLTGIGGNEKVLSITYQHARLLTWQEKTLKKIRSIIVNIGRLSDIKSGIESGLRNGAGRILQNISKSIKGILKRIVIKSDCDTINSLENTRKDYELNSLRDLEANVFAVEKKIWDFSASTTLTDTVENIARCSAALHENFIETLLVKAGRRDIKYKSCVSTATWADNFTVVKIKYVLTN